MTLSIPALEAWLADVNDNADEIAMVADALPQLLAIAKAAQAWNEKSVHTGDANCMAGDHDICTEAIYLDALRATPSPPVAP